jgi:hypothetical protein
MNARLIQFWNRQMARAHKGQRYLALGHYNEMLRHGATQRQAIRAGLIIVGLWPFNKEML